MKRREQSLALGLSIALAALSGCKDDEEAGAAGGGAPARTTKNPSDPNADASVVADAGGDPFKQDCELGEMRLEQLIDGATPHAFALDVAGNQGHLLYTTPGCIGPNGAPLGFDLHAATIPSSGPIGEPRTLAPSDQQCLVTRDLTVSIASSGRALGYHVRTSRATAQLVAEELDRDSEPVVLATAEDRVSLGTGAGAVGATSLVAWATHAPGELSTDLTLYRAQSSSSRRLLIDASEGQRVTNIALHGLGHAPDAPPCGVLAWVDQGPKAAAIRLLRIDETGTPLGDPLTLSEQIGSASSVSAVDHAVGGAVVYTVGTGANRHEIRLQLLTQSGELDGVPIKITSGDQNAHGASIAQYATGYAIAYRVVPSDPLATPVIRVAFTDDRGNIAGRRDVAPASRRTSQTRAVLALDGRLFLAWEDDDGAGKTTLHLVRAVCQ